MPRPTDLPPELEDERRKPGASADPPPPPADSNTPRARNDAALPGSQNADLKGARRDRRLRGATT